MTQKRYINFGAVGNSFEILQGIIKNITDPPAVLSGGILSSGGSSSTLPSFTVAPFAVITTTGYIVEETEALILTLADTVARNYTLIIKHVDNNMIGGTRAITQIVAGLFTTYPDSVVLGWLLYGGSGVDPTDSELWESPRGTNTGSANCGWREVKFPITTNNYYMENSRAGGNGLFISTDSSFTPKPPDTYFINNPAEFISTQSQPYDIQAYNSTNIAIDVNALPQTFTINTAAYGGVPPGAAASVADFVSELTSQVSGISPTLHISSFNSFLKVTSSGIGYDSSLYVSGNSTLLHSVLGWPSGTTAGSESLNPLYEIYTIPAGVTQNFFHTTQFNLKEVPALFDWRFTIPALPSGTTNTFKVNYAKIAVNKISIPSVNIQKIYVTSGTSTLGYNLRILDNSIFEDNLGGVVTVHVDATITNSSLTDLNLTHYYYALQQWAYPMGCNKFFEATSATAGTASVKNTMYVEYTGISGGVFVADSFSDLSFDNASWEYVITDGSNLRKGIIRATWDSTTNTIVFTETHTADVGSTSDVSLAVIINLNIVELRATNIGVSVFTWKALRTIVK